MTHDDRTVASDHALARRCAVGEHDAVAEFEHRYAPTLRGVASRFAGTPAELDDLVQLLRARFLAPRSGGQDPRIGAYQGTGSLEGWLRVASVRALVDARRRLTRRPQDRGGTDALLERVATISADPELRLLQASYCAAFRCAFAEAASALSAEERNLLRYQVVEELTLDQIAALHGLHRSSVDRRLQKARRSLMRETRQRLAARLHLSASEVTGVLRSIESQLDASVARVLHS